MILHTSDPDDAARQVGQGEVSLAFAVKPVGRTVINAAGTGLDPYEASLDEAQETRWQAVKRIREDRKLSGCDTPSGRVDTTEAAQRAITLAMMSATHDSGFTADWKLADNSYAHVDASAMIAIGQAVMAFLSACQARGSALRSVILSADTVASVTAIDLTAGWPS